EGLAFQQSLAELTEGRNPARRLITRDLSPSIDDPVEHLAARVRDYVHVSLEDQAKWQDPEHAFKEWRLLLEAAGVFILKRSFKQKAICGFALYDDEFPLILINNGTAHSRQTFTAFHELAHLLFHVSGITKDDESYIDQLKGGDKHLEETCNAF